MDGERNIVLDLASSLFSLVVRFKLKDLKEFLGCFLNEVLALILNSTSGDFSFSGSKTDVEAGTSGAATLFIGVLSGAAVLVGVLRGLAVFVDSTVLTGVDVNISFAFLGGVRLVGVLDEGEETLGDSMILFILVGLSSR